MHKRVIVIVAAAVMTLGLLAVPAEAHATTYRWDPGCGPFGQSQCGYSTVANGHTIVGACDTYADGLGFATEIRLTNATTSVVSCK